MAGSHATHIRLGSQTVAVSCDIAELLDHVTELLADLTVHDAAEPSVHVTMTHAADGTFELQQDGIRVLSSRNVTGALDQLISWCNGRAVDASSHTINLHAAAVTSPGGGALLLPAVSGSGKSTLSTGLLTRGWGYLSDEMVALDASNMLLPYPKPLTLKAGSHNLMQGRGAPLLNFGPNQVRWYVRPENLGGTLGEPRAPTAIVFPSFAPDVNNQLQPISDAQALLQLTLNVQAPLDSAGHQLEQLAALVCRTMCVRLQHSTLDAALDLLEPLSESVAQTGTFTRAEAPSSEAQKGPVAVPGTVAIHLDGGTILSLPEQRSLLHLNTSGGAIWEQLDGSRTVQQLAVELAEVFGAPIETVSQDVASLCLDLAEHGFLAGVGASQVGFSGS